MNPIIVRRTVCVLTAAALMFAARAQAEPEAGTVAALLGALQVQHGTNWQDASVGTPVFVGDRLRTAPGDAAKIVLRDDSVLELGPDTELVLNTQVFDPAAHRVESLIRLAKGKMRAWVSEYYHEPRAHYEVETPTAIVGVRGTEFIALYDSAAEFTDVVGIADNVEVAAKLAVMGAGVQVGPQLYTRVEKGRFPVPPQRLDDARFRQYLEGLEIIGTGHRDGLSVLHPAVAGRVLAAEDVAPATAGGAPGPTTAAALPLHAPDGSLAEQLSPEIYTNTQPLLDFRNTPPGRLPTGAVTVKIGF
jgi:hypothetical protein